MSNYHTHRFVSFSPRLVGSLIGLTFVGLGLSAAGCGSKQSGSGGGSGGSGLFGKKCGAPTEVAPDLKAPGAMKLPKSRVWIHSAVPTKSVATEMGKEIPVILAQEKDRDVGAPGKASYRVTRGELSFHQLEGGLQVRVPISADVSVCKSIGSACIRYGGCQPKLEARFSVDTQLGKNYEWAAPKGSISATQKCVIGIDVTKQIEAQAKKEVAKVQAEIARQWPQLKPEAKQLWRHFAEPIPLDKDVCVNMAPSKLSYLPPHIEKTKEGDILKAAVGVTGEILPADECKKGKPGQLPSPKAVKSPSDESRLWFPEVLPQQVVREALLESVSGAWTEGGSLEVQEVRLGKNQVALHLKSEGAVCGSFWVTGTLSHKAGAAQLKLADVKVSGEVDDSEDLAALLAGIEGRASVPLASKAWFKGQRLNALKALLTSQVPADVDFKMRKFKAGDAKITVAEDGIYVLHPLTAKLMVSDI